VPPLEIAPPPTAVDSEAKTEEFRSKVAKPSILNKPVLVLLMAPPPPKPFVEVVVFKVNVLAPFKVVVPVPVEEMAPPELPAPLATLLLVNVDAPVMFKIPAFSL
jgi:hypothetical protein